MSTGQRSSGLQSALQDAAPKQPAASSPSALDEYAFLAHRRFGGEVVTFARTDGPTWKLRRPRRFWADLGHIMLTLVGSSAAMWSSGWVLGFEATELVAWKAAVCLAVFWGVLLLLGRWLSPLRHAELSCDQVAVFRLQQQRRRWKSAAAYRVFDPGGKEVGTVDLGILGLATPKVSLSETKESVEASALKANSPGANLRPDGHRAFELRSGSEGPALGYLFVNAHPGGRLQGGILGRLHLDPALRASTLEKMLHALAALFVLTQQKAQ